MMNWFHQTFTSIPQRTGATENVPSETMVRYCPASVAKPESADTPGIKKRFREKKLVLRGLYRVRFLFVFEEPAAIDQRDDYRRYQGHQDNRNKHFIA